MASVFDESEFSSWQQALRDDLLNSEQLAVLQAMVDEGQVEDLEKAAQLLDWQERVINPLEHLYGL
ncbi:MAG: hypothetical protein R3C14_13495 [Caldilineaceae bacterium]